MLYSLELSKFKNLHIILTNKFLIFITKNGIVHFTTNFYNLFILNNKIYFNFNYYSQINNNITLYYINKAFLISNFLTKTSLNYTFNYLNSFYSSLYNLFYNYKVSIYLQGVGYKFICNDSNIQIRVGYSHFVTYNIDKNIYLSLKNPTTLVLYSNNKLILQNFVANLKLCKKTNLYKGTGIFYENELILKKKKIIIKIKMLNNSSQHLLKFNIFKNKYFFVLCFYLKKNFLNNNYIINYLFIGYKYNYLLLNINIFIKTLKNNINIINSIANKNGNITILSTKNKILNFILQKNCIKNNIYYLPCLKNKKQVNLLTYLAELPDLVISFDYKTNAIFLNKFAIYNIPVICVTNSLNKNIINNMMYYLILNNNSLYSNLLIIYIFLNSIYLNQKVINN